ncbi:MAG TPA: GGDEF domain-containing protein [Candidatus Solibacter sp.]|nr:GGDEF domain-containing protein [Candidatus Solibacter sp.]
MEREGPQSIPTGASVQAEQIRSSMRRLQRRQWWMWSSAVLVTLLLTLTIASFAFPGLMSQAEAFSSFYLNQTVRGLVGLVLLFNVYTVYQQTQIHRIQGQLTEQMEAMTKMEVRTEEVFKLAALDALTGLYNRRSGEQRLSSEILRAERTGRPLTILVLDLDGLKTMNDKHGHAAGDELIRTFAQCLNRAIRGSDLAVRFGGDEFLVLLPDCKLEEVRYVLNRLSGHKMEHSGVSVPISFSAGWANMRSGESCDQLLKRADDALYVNKRAGKEGTREASGMTPAAG